MRIAAAALLAVILAAEAPAASPASHTYTIVVDKMKFGAAPAVLHRGDTIVWVNRDMFRHSGRRYRPACFRCRQTSYR